MGTFQGKSVKWWLMAIIFIVALVGGTAAWINNAIKTIDSLQRQVSNLKVEMSTPEVEVFRDSLHIASQSAQVYTASGLKEEKPDVQKLVKETVGTSRTVDDVHTVSTVIRDTVVIDSMKPWHYSDQWIDIKVMDTLLMYSVSDSLTTIVTTEYKHKFLWWRWGKKGYRVQIVSFNPHSHIKYNNYIKILK